MYDGGLELIQWNGSKASGSEKVKAAEFVRKVDDDRKGLAKVVVVGGFSIFFCVLIVRFSMWGCWLNAA